MQRKCFLMQVKPERLQDYLRAHQVWPELLATIREAGICNYSMYFRPDGLLVGYLEGEDIHASLQQVAETEVSIRWEAQMAEFFIGGARDLENDSLEWLEMYFYTE